MRLYLCLYIGIQATGIRQDIFKIIDPIWGSIISNSACSLPEGEGCYRLNRYDQAAAGHRAFSLCQFIRRDMFELVTVSFQFCTCLREFNGEDDRITNW